MRMEDFKCTWCGFTADQSNLEANVLGILISSTHLDKYQTKIFAETAAKVLQN